MDCSVIAEKLHKVFGHNLLKEGQEFLDRYTKWLNNEPHWWKFKAHKEWEAVEPHWEEGK